MSIGLACTTGCKFMYNKRGIIYTPDVEQVIFKHGMVYEVEYINRYNTAASHGLCMTSKSKHIYKVQHVIMISQF